MTSEESIIDTEVCQSCECLIVRDNTLWCKEQRSEKKLNEHCPQFKESEDYKSEKKLLNNPDLFNLITVKELDKKIEKEYEARKAIFLTLNMRKVSNLNKATDNLMVNDTGGTGKDHVTNAVFELIPEEEREKRVRITPKVLNYLNDRKQNPMGWVGKCLYLEDVTNTTINDDGFKVMLSADSNGLTQTSIVSNNSLRNIDILGKPSIVLTVANTSPKQELGRRLPGINLNSSINQTKAILKKQAEFAEKGISPKYNPIIKKSLAKLKRISVKIPYASKIADIFPSGNIIARTHFTRFLDYIKSSCALYQYQRKTDEQGKHIATEQDYEIAREVILATTSNDLMITLTKHQKQILEVMQGLDKDMVYTFQELADLMQHIPIRERWMRIQLDKLSEFGFLKRGHEAREGSFKPNVIYSYVGLNKLQLPKFKDLDSSANTTINTINTNTTNTTNTKEKRVFAVNAVNAFELKE